MSQTTPAPTPKASFFARSRKAFAAGATGGVIAAGGAIGIATSDGQISASDGWIIAGAFVAGFVGPFAATWAATNANG